jgi:hypothetical protein
LYAAILAKMAQNMHIGGKWKWQEGLGALGGAGRPYLGTASSPWPPATSLILPKYKKHTPKLRPPLISYQFKMKGREEASHGLLTHHAYDGAQTDKISCIPTLYITRGATTQKEEGPLHSGPSIGVVGAPFGAQLPLHRLSF